MAGIEDSLELARHLNPEYWGGHSIGVGEANLPPSVPDVDQTSARLHLERGLKRMNGSGPIMTFEEGMVFDPQEVPDGTIVALSEESLIATPDVAGIGMEGFRDLPVPERPIFTAGNEANTRSVEVEGFDYTVALKWGIVEARDSRSRILHIVPARVVQRNNGSTRVGGLPKPRKGPIKIGETVHLRDRIGVEKLTRVNLLEIMAYGGQNGNGSTKSIARALASQA